MPHCCENVRSLFKLKSGNDHQQKSSLLLFYGMAFWNCIRSHIDISRPSEISTFAYLLYIHSVVRCCVVCIENGNNERVGREAHKNYSNNWEEIDLTGLKDLSIKSTHGYSHQINDRSLKSWAVHWCWGLTAPWCGPGSTYLTCYYIVMWILVMWMVCFGMSCLVFIMYLELANKKVLYFQHARSNE